MALTIQPVSAPPGPSGSLDLFRYMHDAGHEQLVFCHDRASGLRAVIAIHDTTLGPALGGCRMWNYPSSEAAALDALRLARGMTYKNSAMGLNLGGGKAVIIGDPRRDKSEALLRAFGRFVQGLGGRYITAEDVGTSPEDIAIVQQETEFVAGTREKSGDPSPATAYGVFRGVQACARTVWGSESLAGRHVAVQGLGHVGEALCRLLHESDARLIVTDIYPERVSQAVKLFGARAVAPEQIYDEECDVFSPCALGAVINDETLPRLRCRVVAGSANNQLQEPAHGDHLHERGILYAPDYIINGGGVINVAHERYPGGYNRERAYLHIGTIFDKLTSIIGLSRTEGIPTHVAADRFAERRLREIGELQRIRVGQAARGG